MRSVKHSRPFVETPRVPRVHKAELLEVEMMTEFVAEGAQELPNDVTSFRTAVRIQTRISMDSGL